MKFCSRLGAGEGRGSRLFSVILCQNVDLKVSIFLARGGGSDPVDTSFPIHPASLRICMTPNKLNVLDVPSCYSTNDENENTAKVYFYLTCALYWNDRIWDITCSSCAVGAHSIAVIQSVFWCFIHVHCICFS